MAVKLKHLAQLTLLVVLALQADTYIVNVHMQLLNARFVVQRQLIILVNAIRIRSNSCSVRLLVVLCFCDRVVKFHNLNTECLDCDDLIGVDVELLLVFILVARRLCDVEGLHSLVVVISDDGASPAFLDRCLGLCQNFSLSFSLSLSLGFNLSLGLCLCLNLGLSRSLDLGLSLRLGLCFNLGLSLDFSLGFGFNLNLGLGLGLNLDLSSCLNCGLGLSFNSSFDLQTASESSDGCNGCKLHVC